MKDNRFIIVDWTRSMSGIGVFSKNNREELFLELKLPSRLVVSTDPSGNLRVFGGEEAAAITESPNALIFENPAGVLAKIDDPELSSLLVDGVWRFLEEQLLALDLVVAGGEIATYVVTPQNLPLDVRESFRVAGTKHTSLKLIACIQESMALVVGALRALVFGQEEDVPAEVTLGLVVALDEQTINVSCFDYERLTPTDERILIRDCFQTTCADLPRRLHDCDWLGALARLTIIEDPELPASARAAIDWPFQAIAGDTTIKRQALLAASQLKLMGAAHIALCALGQAPDDQEYCVANAWHIGLQVDQQYFHPVLKKEAWSWEGELPALTAQAFGLRGQTENSLRLNFFAGYSTCVADAIPLGHSLLSSEELDQLNEANTLTAVLSFDQPGSGEFLLGVMPDNRILRRLTFTLPGIVV